MASPSDCPVDHRDQIRCNQLIPLAPPVRRLMAV